MSTSIVVRGIRPRVLKQRLVLCGFGALLAASVVSMPAAKADPALTHAEAAYIQAYHGPICSTIAKYPSEGGVTGVLSVIIDDGFTGPESAEIVNASVAVYCPEWFPLLQAIGDRARAQDTGAYVA